MGKTLRAGKRLVMMWTCTQAAGQARSSSGTPCHVLFPITFLIFYFGRWLFVCLSRGLRIIWMAFSLHSPFTVYLLLNYCWNETVKCHLGCSQAHFSLLQLHISGTVETSTWSMLKISTYKHTCIDTNSPSHIHLLFSGTACRWEQAVIKAYHRALSTALCGLPVKW